jgi:hypothetical protein
MTSVGLDIYIFKANRAKIRRIFGKRNEYLSKEPESSGYN